MINLQNYEEWFLLYTDNELSSEQKQMVENFVSENPELKEELDLLQETIVPIENRISNDWNTLIKNEVPEWEELALLAIDDELSGDGKKEWENILQNSAESNYFFNTLKATKLSNDIIVFQDKKSLVRQESKPKTFPLWIRYASIAAILSGILLMVWNEQKTNQTKLASIVPSKPIIISQNTTIVTPTKNITKPELPSKKDKEKDFDKHEEDYIASSKQKSLRSSKIKSYKATENKSQIIVNPLISTLENSKDVVAIVPSATIISAKPNVINAVFVTSDQPKKEVKSGKRFVMLDDENSDRGKLYVANTEINTQKLFGWLKKNKFGKTKENTKKVEIANFEISIKTNDL